MQSEYQILQHTALSKQVTKGRSPELGSAMSLWTEEQKRNAVWDTWRWPQQQQQQQTYPDARNYSSNANYKSPFRKYSPTTVAFAYTTTKIDFRTEWENRISLEFPIMLPWSFFFLHWDNDRINTQNERPCAVVGFHSNHWFKCTRCVWIAVHNCVFGFILLCIQTPPRSLSASFRARSA